MHDKGDDHVALTLHILFPGHLLLHLATHDFRVMSGFTNVVIPPTSPPLVLPSSLLFRCSPQEELKSKHKELVRQLCSQLQASLGSPLRSCLARVFVALYEAGETFSMHETVGKCCDIVRSKEEGPSTNKL